MLFTNSLTAIGYQHIINEYLTPYFNKYYSAECIIIQENSPNHTANICLEAFKNNHLEWVFFSIL